MKRQLTERRHMVAWLALPVMAVVNGLIRDTTYGRLLGYDLSHALSVAPLLVAIVVWAAFLAKRWPLPFISAAFRVGLVWLALTVVFELGLGSLQGFSLDAMLAEYDITRGKLWPLIPLSTLLAPVLVRELFSRSTPKAFTPVIVFPLLLLAAPVAADAQAADDGSGRGYFGAPVAAYTRLRGNGASMIGGRGGWNVAPSLTLGGGLYGTLTEVDAPPNISGASGPLDLKLEVFGLEAEYTLRRDAPIQITLSTFLGGAAARYTRDGTNDQHGETDFLFMTEPAAGLEREVLTWLRVNLAACYRFVAGVEQEGLRTGDLAGPVVRLTLKLGRF
jgi:hypothetical protein